MTAREKLYQAMTPVVVLALLDEIEALRKDAERYRWLRDIGDATWKPMAHRDRYCTAAGIDAAIDAARTQGGDACK